MTVYKGCAMSDIASLLDEHVALRCECIDRIFLNGYIPRLQDAQGLSYFLREHRGEEISRYALIGEMTKAFVAEVDRMAEEKNVPVVHFERGQRKEAIAAPYLAAAKREGVVMIGIAQEKANAFRAVNKLQREKGKYAVTRTSVFVKHIYFYIWDNDFGPSFIKICTYAPWSIRVWLNGNEWLKRQMEHRHIAYQPLDNGFASVDDPVALQKAADRLSPAHIQRYFDKWIYRLPSPLTQHDRTSGYAHQLSILQMEMSCTDVFDRPLHGRQFFEEVIRDQLDLGRPEKMQVLFHKRIPRRKGEGPFKTRIFSSGVNPSIHIEHRRTSIKQYWKCDRALRTETTINDAHDFGVGKLLANFNTLRQIGNDINHRLLDLERQTQQCTPAATTFETMVLPSGDAGHRAPALRFGDPRVVGLFAALCDFRLLITGVRNKDLRPLVEHHLAHPYSTRQMSYDLRRLQRKGLVERQPYSNRYLITALGRQLILFCAKFYSRVIGAHLGQLDNPRSQSPLAIAWRNFDHQADTLLASLHIPG